MWILPSRSRPHNIKRLMAAYERTGASTPVWLRLDDDDPMLSGYPVAVPPLWTVEIGPRLPLSDIYLEAYQRYPDALWHGFIADDVVPETQKWDLALIKVAGADGMAVPAGGHDPAGAPHFVLGGALVRSIGWLSLPGLKRLYIDTVWIDIAKSRGVFKRVPEVILKHHHFSCGLSLFDKTYRKSPEVKAHDKKLYDRWCKNTEQETCA